MLSDKPRPSVQFWNLHRLSNRYLNRLPAHFRPVVWFPKQNSSYDPEIEFQIFCPTVLHAGAPKQTGKAIAIAFDPMQIPLDYFC